MKKHVLLNKSVHLSNYSRVVAVEIQAVVTIQCKKYNEVETPMKYLIIYV